MERYANRGGNSSIASFEIGSTSISVKFRDGLTYVYTYESTGQGNVEQMKQLAKAGQGLASFIVRVVGKGYARKY